MEWRNGRLNLEYEFGHGIQCPECKHGVGSHTSDYEPLRAGCSNEPGSSTGCGCLYYVELEKKGEGMEPEIGVGSPLKKWVCQCPSHVVDVKSGRTRSGPYIIRVSGDGLVAVCQWCEAPFVMADEGLPKKRRSKICGAHCPEGAHSH